MRNDRYGLSMRKAALTAFGAAALTLTAWGYAYSCWFNVDCSPGSRCVRNTGEIEGVCIGGLFPGNRYDLDPPEDPLSEGYGATCETGYDCPYPLACVKQTASVYGTCL